MKLFLSFSLVGALFSASAYDLLSDGAMADVRFRVVDDRGVPVENVVATICFQKTFTSSDVIDCQTDVNGICAAKHSSIGEMRAYFKKDGYYETGLKPQFRQWDWKKAQDLRKWSDGTVDIPIVLKAKRNPIETVLHSVTFKPFPNTNEVVKLDLEMLEWCPPYGNGKHDDLHLVFDGWRNPLDWDDYHEHLRAVFPNAADGFYRLKVEPFTAFPYAYAADTNRVYEKSFAFRHVHTKAGITESRRFANDEYLIYRVRTVTNELGEVTHANYGRIGEKLGQYFGLSMKSWFNPTDNDPNLEDSRQF